MSDAEPGWRNLRNREQQIDFRIYGEQQIPYLDRRFNSRNTDMRERMKRIALTAALLSILSFGGAISLSAGFVATLLIASQSSVAESGQDIRVNVELINGSSKPMPLTVLNEKGHAELLYNIKVTRQDKRRVEQIDFAGADPIPVIVGRQSMKLQPGGSYSDYFMLNRVFDVTKPGVYFVQVQEEPMAGRVAARSSRIEIVVR